jgi:hypothetical protein
LFPWRREPAVKERVKRVDERAELIARMVMLIVHSLQTKSYEAFVESFSNPGNEPASVDRMNQQIRFQMRISPTCWYEAIAEYRRGDTPFFRIEGGGDDFGVLINGDAIGEHRIGVDFWVPTNSRSGRDTRAMVHALRGMPGWSRGSDIELAAFAASRHVC